MHPLLKEEKHRLYQWWKQITAPQNNEGNFDFVYKKKHNIGHS